jgi:hypothetical protein
MGDQICCARRSLMDSSSELGHDTPRSHPVSGKAASLQRLELAVGKDAIRSFLGSWVVGARTKIMSAFHRRLIL